MPIPQIKGEIKGRLRLLTNFSFLSNMFLAIGPGQIALIAVVLLIMVGGKKIPELMKGLGKGMKEFKDASKGDGEGKGEVTSKEEK